MPPYMKNKIRIQHDFYQQNFGSVFCEKVADLVKSDSNHYPLPET